MIGKSPEFVQFGFNLTHFRPKSDIDEGLWKMITNWPGSVEFWLGQLILEHYGPDLQVHFEDLSSNFFANNYILFKYL